MVDAKQVARLLAAPVAQQLASRILAVLDADSAAEEAARIDDDFAHIGETSRCFRRKGFRFDDDRFRR